MIIEYPQQVEIPVNRWKMELVRLADLRIDPTYHDPARYDDKRASAMAANWNPEAVGIIHVSHRRDGSWITIDGNHRVCAGRKIGVTHLMAKVFYDISVAEEAEIFRILSDAVRLNSYALFKAALTEGKPEAVAIATICENAGVSIVSSGTAVRAAPGRTRAIQILDTVYRAGYLPETLNILREAWPEDMHSVDGVAIQGVASFLRIYHNHPWYTRKRLINKLSEQSALALIRKAKDLTVLGLLQPVGGRSGDTSALRPDATSQPGMGMPNRGDRSTMAWRAPRTAVLIRYNERLQNKLDDVTLSDLVRLRLGYDIWADLREKIQATKDQ